MSQPDKEPVQVTEQAAGISGLTDEQLEQAIDKVDELPLYREPPDEPEEDTAEAEVSEEEESEEEAAEEETPPTEPVDEGQEEDPEPDEPNVQEARAEEMAARAKHFESVAGRMSGKLGHMGQQYKQLQDEVATLRQAVQDGVQPEPSALYEEPAHQPQAALPPAPTVDPNALWASRSAATKAVSDFEQSTPEVWVEVEGKRVVDPKFVELATARQQELAGYAGSGDAAFAESETRAFLREVWSEVEVSRAQARREDAERRTADQSKRVRGKKLAQASAGVSSRSAAPSRRRVTSIKKLKDDELGSLIDSRAGLDS